jgi:hypothetical protein
VALNALIQGYKQNWKAMLRCRDANVIRGFVSDSYGRYNNLTMLEAIAPYVVGTGAVTKMDYSNEYVFHLSLTFPRHDVEVRRGDIISTGLHLSNSEVGFRSIWVAGYANRLACLNGAVTEEGTGSTHIRHSGEEENLTRRVKALVEGAYLNSTKLVEKFRESINKVVNDPQSYMEKIANAHDLTKSDLTNMLNAFRVEPENNLYGITNAVTRMAHDSYEGEDRFQMERLGAKVLEAGLKNL